MHIGSIVKTILRKVIPSELIKDLYFEENPNIKTDYLSNGLKPINITELEEKRNRLKNDRQNNPNQNSTDRTKHFRRKTRWLSLVHTQNITDSTVKKGHRKSEKVMEKKRRSTSLAPRVYSERKRRTRSTLNEIEPNRPLNKSEYFNSIVRTTKRISYTPRESKNRDPVKDQWASAGTAQAVYSVSASVPSKPKPTKYWVNTQLQYVLVLPTDKRRRKSSSPIATTTGKEWEPRALEGKELGPREKESFSNLELSASTSESDSEDIEEKPPTMCGKMKQLCCVKGKNRKPATYQPKTILPPPTEKLPSKEEEPQALKGKELEPREEDGFSNLELSDSTSESDSEEIEEKPPTTCGKMKNVCCVKSQKRKPLTRQPKKMLPPPTEKLPSKEWKPQALEGKDLGPRIKESFSSLDDYGSKSISDAKFAPRPKGRFCCVKRQDSG